MSRRRRQIALTPGVRLRIGQRVLLTAEILRDYARARRLMRRESLGTALAALRAPGAEPSGLTDQDEFLTAARLGRAVMLVLARLPTDRRCLVRSLTLSSLVARRGIPARLVIGVEPNRTTDFMAHAWVEHGDRPVLPDEGYARLHAL